MSMSNVYHCTYGLSRNKQALEIVMAARDHDISRVKTLLANDAAVVNDPGPYMRTALHISALCGHADVVSLLLHHNADVHSTEMLGMTALHLACEFGHAKSAELLLSHGAIINARDMYDRTPLYVASQMSHGEVVELLLSRGADAALADVSGTTPYSVCTRQSLKLKLKNAVIYQRRAGFLMFLAHFQFLKPPSRFPRESSVEKVFAMRDLYQYIMQFL